MGNNQDQFQKMTETPVKKLVVTLGIPTTISMLVSNIYNMADTYFVGEIGTSASGAIGIAFGLMAVLQAFGFMFGQGAGSLISRKLGGKDNKSAEVYAATSLFLAILTGVIIGTVCILNIDGVLKLLGSTPTILPYAKDYMVWILLAGPFIMGSFVLNNVLRFEGRASLAMIGLVSGAVINIICDPVFINVLGLGIAGAGISTAISQFIGFCILSSIFIFKKSSIVLSVKNIRLRKNVIWEIVSTGFPSMIRQGLTSISTIILNRIAGNYQDACIAAISIVNRLNFFMFAIGLGMGQGFQPVCGYNYGAKKYGRVKEAFLFTLLLGEIALGTLGIIGFGFSPYLIKFFRNDSEVIRIGTRALRYSCVALLFQPLCVMANMTFQSTGNKKQANFTSTLRSGLYFIPTLYIMEHFFGEQGIILAQPLCDVMAFVTLLPLITGFIRQLGRLEEE